MTATHQSNKTKTTTLHFNVLLYFVSCNYVNPFFVNLYICGPMATCCCTVFTVSVHELCNKMGFLHWGRGVSGRSSRIYNQFLIDPLLMNIYMESFSKEVE